MNSDNLNPSQNPAVDTVSLFYQSLRESVLTISPEATVLYSNPAAEIMFSTEPGGLRGRLISELLSTEIWNKLNQQFNPDSINITPRLDFRLQRLDRIERVVSAALIPGIHFSHSGDKVLIIQDITGAEPEQIIPVHSTDLERQVADRTVSLQASEYRYRLLASMSSDYAACIRVDEQGRFITEWVAGSFEDITGYPVHYNQPANMDSTHPDDRVKQERDIQLTLENKKTTTEIRTVKSDGSEIWLRITRQPIWDDEQNRVSRYLVVAQNITDRKQADKALEESEHRYKLLSSMTSDYAASVYVEHDGSLVTEWAVGSFAEITGHAIKLGKEADLDSTHPDDIAKQRGDIQRTIKDNVPTVTEFRSLKPNGDPIWLRVSRKPVWDEEEQRVSRFIAVAQDITERKNTEEELRKSQVQQAELEGIHKTVATLAHEINNPLTGIIATLQMAPEPDMKEGELHEMLEAALNAAYSIRNVVAKIQELRKPTYRPYLDNREIIDIHGDDEGTDS